MTYAADPMLMERALAAVAASTVPLTEHAVSRLLGNAPVGDALRALVREGLLTDGPRHAATDLGRQRAADGLAAEFDAEMQDDADALVASLEPMMPTDEELVFMESLLDPPILASWQVPDERAAIIASMNQLAPSPALIGWTASARHALEDHRRRPSLRTALRARDMVRRAIEAYDPAALPPLDQEREQAITAALAPRRPAPQHDACCDGLCGVTGKDFG